MSFKKNLNGILEELGQYKKKDAKLFNKYVNEKLNKSLETYYKELEASSNYLVTESSEKIKKDILKGEN